MRPIGKAHASNRCGFTLVEMVAVMAITGIVAAVVAIFIRLPMQAYQDIQRRAEITDAADTIFSRVKRDLQTALPNSVRITTNGAVNYLEMLPTLTGGRYRAALSSTPANVCNGVPGDAGGDVLAFGASDTCFTTLGDLPNLPSVTGIIAAGTQAYLVVYNLGSGFAGADAYVGGNRSQMVSVAAGAGGENIIQFNAHNFALESPGRRFHIVTQPISYVCDPAVGTFKRVTGYGIGNPQPQPAGGDLLAQNIAACTITYDQNVINQRVGIVTLSLTFSDPAGGANVNLIQQIQVSNVP